MARRHKRPNVRPPESQMIPEHKEDLAADRREQESYPTNQFPVAAAMIGAVIVIVGMVIAFGWVKP